MASRIFRIFNPDGTTGTGEDRVQKRRAQLRQAQRTYRDRKDKYARCLEGEIARARANEAYLLSEIQRLQQTIQALERTLRQQDLGQLDSAYLLAGSRETHDWDNTGQDENLSAPSEPTFVESPLSPEIFVPRPPPKDSREAPMGTRDVCLGGSSMTDTLYQTNARMCDLDPVDAGMDFVLSLERPCLGHLHGNEDKPDEPGGHALTASAQVLSTSPLAASTSPLVPGTLCRNVPAATLDSLLSLSSALCSDEEVTPVQAWNYIRRRPQFGGLAARNMFRLAETLRDAVKCHGFGAVIQKGMFERLVLQTMVGG